MAEDGEPWAMSRLAYRMKKVGHCLDHLFSSRGMPIPSDFSDFP
jgi:hypothetical protein